MATVALFWLVFWVILDAALALPKVLAIVSTVCRDGDLRPRRDDALAVGTSARE